MGKFRMVAGLEPGEPNLLKRTAFAFLFLFSGALIFSCGRKEEPRAAPVPERLGLSAKFYYDLGAASVDVSAYPEKIRDGYKTFLSVCNSCHSSARPLNSPIVSAADWKRFIRRMHLRAEGRGVTLSRRDEKDILEFLAYDSKERKLGRAQEFQAEQERLKALFAEVVREKERLLVEETEKLPKKETPYVGVK